MRLHNKVALITGAGSGLGRATSMRFSQEGAKVVVVDLLTEFGEETVREIIDRGGRAIFVKGDVSSRLDVEAMVKRTNEEFGRIDILHNNAGIKVNKGLLDTEEDEWDKVIDVNLKSVFLGSKLAAPYMIKQGGGSIINTASIFGTVSVPRALAYCASKGGVMALTRALALELAPYKIRVNCICPGAMETRQLESTFKSRADPEGAKKDTLAQIPLSRLGQPSDIANAAVFLASEESSFITGAALCVDGGYTAH